MKISFDYPPIYEEIKKKFKLSGREVFTFGDTIYNPAKLQISDHLMIHEETHGEQQKHDDTVAKIWWQRYLQDKEFLLNQEVEAYSNQYKFICNKVKDRNARFRNLHIICQDLAGPMYGNAISYTDAMRRIRNGK